MGSIGGYGREGTFVETYVLTIVPGFIPWFALYVEGPVIGGERFIM